MKLKKVLSVALVAVMTMSMAACGGSNNAADNGGATNGAASDNSAEATNDAAATESSDAAASTDGSLSYADIKLGEDYTDLTATISLFNHRTDLESDDYNGTTWKEYLAAFNEMYPNITVELTTDTNYADDALMHLQSGDYETVMMIPAVDKADLSNYFISYGDLDTMKTQINYATTWADRFTVFLLQQLHRVSYTIKKYLRKQELQNFQRLRKNLSMHYRKSKIIQMPSHFIQTMQQAGQWEHGMLTSEIMQQATIHI